MPLNEVGCVGVFGRTVLALPTQRNGFCPREAHQSRELRSICALFVVLPVPFMVLAINKKISIPAAK
jgi:hypothetical protein